MHSTSKGGRKRWLGPLASLVALAMGLGTVGYAWAGQPTAVPVNSPSASTSQSASASPSSAESGTPTEAAEEQAAEPSAQVPVETTTPSSPSTNAQSASTAQDSSASLSTPSQPSAQNAPAGDAAAPAPAAADSCNAVTTWATLQNCVENAKAGTETTVLLAGMIVADGDDATVTQTIIVHENAKVTIDVAQGADSAKVGVTGTKDAATGKAVRTRSASVFSVLNGGTLTINGGTYKDLNSSQNGAVVLVNANGALAVNGGTFQGNAARNGGAVFAETGTAVTVKDGLFDSNVANQLDPENKGGKGGGALYVKGTTSISGGTFSNNAQKPEGCKTGDIQQGDPCWKGKSGGGAIYSLGDLTIQGNVTFETNQASAWSWHSGGGAIWAHGTLRIANVTTYDEQGNPTVERPQFKGNYASVTAPEMTADRITKIWNGGAGGAVFLDEGSVAYVTGGTYTGNASGYLGGAIYTEFDSTTYVGRSVSTGNTAGHFGGGLWFCPSGSATAYEGGNIALFDNAVDASIDANGANLPANAGFPTEAGADLAIMNPYKKWADNNSMPPNSFKLLSSWFTDRTEQAVTWYRDGTPVTEASGFYDGWTSGSGGAHGHGITAVKAEPYEESPRYAPGAASNEKVIKSSTTTPESTNLYLYVADSSTHRDDANKQDSNTTTKFTTGVGLKAEVMPDANKQEALDNAQILIEGNAARLSGGGFGSNGVVSFSTPYNVSWEKAATDLNGKVTDTLLKGSEWTLSITDEELNKNQAQSPYMVEDFRPYRCLTKPDDGCWQHDDATHTWTVTIHDGGMGDTNPGDGQIGVENLQLGKYTLRESKAPTGYELNQQTYTFTIERPSGNAIPQEPKLYVQNGPQIDGNRIGNSPQTNGISWGKTSGVDGAKIGGSTWKLTQVADDKETDVTGYEKIEDCVTGTGATSCPDTKDTNGNAGEFTLQNLPYGTYRLYEVQAPEGYWKPGTGVWYQVVVSEGPAAWTDSQGNKLAVADFTNTPTAVSWQKVDATSPSTLLGGSQWTIEQRDDQGQPVQGKKWTVADCTNANKCKPSTDGLASPRDTDPVKGKFTVQGLSAGTYNLVEAQAPDGYAKSDAVYTFTIGETETNVAITVNGHSVKDNAIANARAIAALPHTGGWGTGRAWLTAGGVFLVAGGIAGAWLDARRRRMASMVAAVGSRPVAAGFGGRGRHAAR